MEKIHFTVDPRYLLRQMIYQIYEQNINQYKENEELVELKYATYQFLYNSKLLENDEYIDKNVHKLIHLKNNDKIQIYLKHFEKIVSNYADFIKRLNKYRLLAGNREINLSNN